MLNLFRILQAPSPATSATTAPLLTLEELQEERDKRIAAAQESVEKAEANVKSRATALQECKKTFAQNREEEARIKKEYNTSRRNYERAIKNNSAPDDLAALKAVYDSKSEVYKQFMTTRDPAMAAVKDAKVKLNQATVALNHAKKDAKVETSKAKKDFEQAQKKLKEEEKKKKDQELKEANAAGGMSAGVADADKPDELSESEKKQIEGLHKECREACEKVRRAYHEHGDDWISKIMANISNMMRAGQYGRVRDAIFRDLNAIAKMNGEHTKLEKKIEKMQLELNQQPPPAAAQRDKLEKQIQIHKQKLGGLVADIKDRLWQIQDTKRENAKNYKTGKYRDSPEEFANRHQSIGVSGIVYRTSQLLLSPMTYLGMTGAAVATTGAVVGYGGTAAVKGATAIGAGVGGVVGAGLSYLSGGLAWALTFGKAKELTKSAFEAGKKSLQWGGETASSLGSGAVNTLSNAGPAVVNATSYLLAERFDPLTSRWGVGQTPYTDARKQKKEGSDPSSPGPGPTN